MKKLNFGNNISNILLPILQFLYAEIGFIIKIEIVHEIEYYF